MPDGSVSALFPPSGIQDLIEAAAALEGGSTADVMGPDRKRRASRSRQAAMWLAFKMTPRSLSDIGRALGRHHTTVLYGIRAYERRLAEDARARSEELLTRLLASEPAAADPVAPGPVAPEPAAQETSP